MVDVDHHHLGRAARGAARLDRAGRAVADLEEAHEARGSPAARELLALAPQLREVGAGAGAVLEEAGLAHPQVHDAALVHEVVLDALDEAGMRLRMLVGGLRLRQLAGLVVHVEMALARPVDAVGPVKAGVEPLRAVRRHHLAGEHETQFVIEGPRILLGGEVAALPAPIGPAAGEAIEDLLRAGLGAGALVLRLGGEGRLVGHGAPQEGGDVVLLDFLQARGHAGLAEILLREHVAGDLRPGIRHLDIVELEDDGPIRVADLAGGAPKREVCIGREPGSGVAPLDPHHPLSSVAGDTMPPRHARGMALSAHVFVQRPHGRLFFGRTQCSARVSDFPGRDRTGGSLCRASSCASPSGRSAPATQNSRPPVSVRHLLKLVP